MRKDQKRLAAMPMLLTDNARHWYANLDPTSFTSYDELKIQNTSVRNRLNLFFDKNSLTIDNNLMNR